MEFHQIRSFAKIAETGNLRKAAEQLFISQSALSSQIKVLESSLDLQLFKRTSRGMELTDQGRILYSHALDILGGVADFEDKAKQLTGRISQSIRIGINTDGHFLRVGKLSRVLNSHFPGSSFFFVASQTIRTVEMLRDGSIDVGFYFGDELENGIYSQLLSYFYVRVVIPEKLLPEKEVDLTWAELARLPWIWSVCDCPFYGILQKRFDEEKLEPNRFVDAMDESVVKELVMDGQGVGILRDDDARYVASLSPVKIWQQERFPVALRLGMLRENRKNRMLAEIFRMISEVREVGLSGPNNLKNI